jgi:DNA-binding NarL/FixJ family response regulator
MRALLTELPGQFEVVAEAFNLSSALEACRRAEADLLILDERLPGGSPREAFRRLGEIRSLVKLLVYCSSGTEGGVISAVRSGADGVIDKDISRREFLDAVTKVACGQRYFSPRGTEVLTEIARGMHPEKASSHTETVLSPREKQILMLVAAGRTSKEIASFLHLSPATVVTHRRNCMAKVGAHNAADLIRYGHEHALLGAVARYANGNR